MRPPKTEHQGGARFPRVNFRGYFPCFSPEPPTAKQEKYLQVHAREPLHILPPAAAP